MVQGASSSRLLVHGANRHALRYELHQLPEGSPAGLHNRGAAGPAAGSLQQQISTASFQDGTQIWEACSLSQRVFP